MRQFRIYICSSCMKTRQMLMVDSVYLDEPRVYNIGVLLFRIRYESMSVTYEGISLNKKVKHFGCKTNKSSLALM